MQLRGGFTNHAYHVRKKSRANFLHFELQMYFAKRYTRRSVDSSPISAVRGKTANAFPCSREYQADPFRGKKYTVYISLTVMVSFFDCEYFQGIQKVID